MNLNTYFQIWRRLRTHGLLSPYPHIFVVWCQNESPRAPRKHKGTVIIQTFLMHFAFITHFYDNRGLGCCDFGGLTHFVQGGASTIPQIGHDHLHIFSSYLCTKHPITRRCIFWANSLNSLKASRRRTRFSDRFTDLQLRSRPYAPEAPRPQLTGNLCPISIHGSPGTLLKFQMVPSTQYSDYATGWMVRGSNPNRYRDFSLVQ